MKNSNKNWQLIMFAAIAIGAFLFAAQTRVSGQKNEEPALPKPDFSAMEMWYEVGDKIKHDVFAAEMTFFVKAKKDDKRLVKFSMQFLDEDGTVLKESVLWGMHNFAADTPSAPIKVTVETPTEYYLPKVKASKVIRYIQ